MSELDKDEWTQTANIEHRWQKFSNAVYWRQHKSIGR